MSQNDSQENKKPKRIDSSTRYLLIGTAIIFDLISIIPVVGQVLAIGGAGITFYIWFKILGVSFISPKKIVTTVVEYLGEAIPVVSALPLITTGTIIMIVLTDIEDKTGIGLAGLATGKVSKGKVTTTAQRAAAKTARREANPERALQARERLAKMKENRAKGASSTVSANRQTMKDIKAPQNPTGQTTSPTPQKQNPQQLSRASERLRLIRGGGGVGQEISAPNQQPTKNSNPLNDYSPSRDHVENRENRAA